jgi:hypothetical protein
VTTRDSASGQLVNADVVVSGPSYSASVNTGSAEYTESNWSGGRYVSATNISAGADVELAGSPGTYSTSSVGILESNTIDLGGVSASLHGLSWWPELELWIGECPGCKSTLAVAEPECPPEQEAA